MTMTITQQIITVVVVVLGTMTTRFLPFIIFPGGILSEGCDGKYALRTAGADRNTVHCGIT